MPTRKPIAPKRTNICKQNDCCDWECCDFGHDTRRCISDPLLNADTFIDSIEARFERTPTEPPEAA